MAHIPALILLPLLSHGLSRGSTPAAKLHHVEANTTEEGPTQTRSNCVEKAWDCPASWTTGEDASANLADAPDAKAFVAVHNIYRCMHNVQAVQWSPDVHAGAKKWAEEIDTNMQHSHADTEFRKMSDGENLASTYKFSKHRGVDAAHMWYAEIEQPCGYSTKCFQSFDAGHFTAMIWKSVSKIAYSDTTGKIAVGRYRGCDGKPPNFNNAYGSMVPPPVDDWETCAKKVLSCPAFSGMTEDHVEGCESGGACCKGSENDGWYVNYGTTCKAKYAGIKDKITAVNISKKEVMLLGLMAGGRKRMKKVQAFLEN